MLRFRDSIAALAVVTCLWTATALHAQTSSKVPDAPLPAALHTAKNVFISFAGADALIYGDPRQIYNHFYAEMKARKRYTLVDSPAAADLILEISFANPISKVEVSPGAGGSWGGSFNAPQLHLGLLAPKTGIVLWGLTQRVASTLLTKNLDKNIEAAVHKLAADLDALNASSPSK